MKFNQALKLLKKGKHIRRQNWSPDWFYYAKNDFIYAVDDYTLSAYRWNNICDHGEPVVICLSDLLADDWEEVKRS